LPVKIGVAVGTAGIGLLAPMYIPWVKSRPTARIATRLGGGAALLYFGRKSPLAVLAGIVLIVVQAVLIFAQWSVKRGSEIGANENVLDDSDDSDSFVDPDDMPVVA